MKSRIAVLTAIAAAALLGHQPPGVAGPHLEWLRSRGLCSGLVAMYQGNDAATIDISDLITGIGEVGRNAAAGRADLKRDIEVLKGMVPPEVGGLTEGEAKQLIRSAVLPCSTKLVLLDSHIGLLNDRDVVLSDSLGSLRRRVDEIGFVRDEKQYSIGAVVIPAAAVSVLSLVFALAIP